MIDQATRDEWARWAECDLATWDASIVRALLAEVTRLESLYAAASSTADSLEAINEAQVERARRHNEEVQAVIDGSAKVHAEDQAMIVGYQQTVATLELDLQATVDGARIRHGEDAARIKALEAGLREACDWSTRPGLVGVDVRFNVPHEAETVPRFTRIGDRRISERIAELRDLAGEP